VIVIIDVRDIPRSVCNSRHSKNYPCWCYQHGYKFETTGTFIDIRDIPRSVCNSAHSKIYPCWRYLHGYKLETTGSLTTIHCWSKTMEYHSLQVGRNHRMKRRHKKISAPTRMKQIVTEHTITITNCNHTVLIKRRQFVSIVNYSKIENCHKLSRLKNSQIYCWLLLKNESTIRYRVHWLTR
jgi:hypothetical protein